MGVKIGYSDFKRHARSENIRYPSNDSGDLSIAVERIFAELHLRRIRIRHAGVSVSQIEMQNYQRSLFNEQVNRESLNSAVDDIRERFGFMALMPADTLELKRKYRMDAGGYILHNPALTR